MASSWLFFLTLAISTICTHALPAQEIPHHVPTHTRPEHPKATHHCGKIIHAGPNHDETYTHHCSHHATKTHHTTAAPPNPSAIYAQDAILMANGPPTALDAAQRQASKDEAQIAAVGWSMHVAGVSSAAAAATAPADCNDGTWALNAVNYNKFDTDRNLRTWWYGGKDTDGITFPPTKAISSVRLTEQLALTLEPVGSSFVCTLESHICQPAQDCNNYGVHMAVDKVSRPSHWGWFAVHSIANVWSFAETFSAAFTNAGVGVSMANLDLTKVFSKPSANPQLFLRDLLLGFGFVASAIFTLIPVAGPLIGVAAGTAAMTAIDTVGAVGAIAGSTVSTGGAFLGLSLASGVSLDVKAADFGAFMMSVFNETTVGIDKLVSEMMAGSTLGGATPLLLDVLTAGGWVSDSVINSPSASFSNVYQVLQKDLMQRGINFIWGQSKIWVSFANLNDDAQQTKCLADKNGWQASKTCADGGVYYLYRFNEDGDHTGHLDYPWGADKMAAAPFFLDPSWATHSSASAYRSQNHGTGGFAYDYTQAPTNLPTIFSTIGHTGSLADLNALQGVWNLSVCDMGAHADWNTDFTQSTVTSRFGLMAFPCCCGPQCSQTAAFIQSAQMDNFDTLFQMCHQQLALCDAWPPGTTEVNFGGSGKIVKQAPQGGNCIY